VDQEKRKQWSRPPAMQLAPDVTYQATLQTNKGTITVDLLREDAPKTVNNFVFLARAGFYDGVPFHRVIAGFMIQSGDPTGTGTGGPGYRFEDEPVKRRYQAGTVAMANAGPNTNGSQFFIMHRAQGLPPNYTIFGQVSGADSMDVVDAIARTPCGRSRSGEQSTPLEPFHIEAETSVETPAAGAAQ
jgi:cyclophilin family peptidyl-prolyl cis-trans isomerase